MATTFLIWQVHILLKGVVDFSKEAARLQKEATALEGRYLYYSTFSKYFILSTFLSPTQRHNRAREGHAVPGHPRIF